MVRIADRTLAAAQEEAASGNETFLQLLLRPVGDVAAAQSALKDSVLELHAVHEEAEQASGSEVPWPGEWTWIAVSDGVLIQVAECEALVAVLYELAGALGRRDVQGVLDLPDTTPGQRRPMRAHMIECRLVVRGGRVHRGPRDHLWQPDPQAAREVLDAAVRWCRRGAAHAAHSLRAAAIDPIAVDPEADVLERMVEALSDRLSAEFSVVTAHAFRSVAIRAFTGRVSLVEGGAWIEGTGWKPVVEGFRTLLRDHADRVAYGSIRRGWAVDEALLDDSIACDWPMRQDREPDGIGFTPHAFEDAFAADAFPVQLLGRGYAGRIPDAPDWRAERVGTAAVLLEHVDPPAWFDAPFVPYGDRRWHLGDPQPPEVLARAREDLRPLLYVPGVLTAGGYADDIS